jgi:hypothetical protein
MQVVFLGRPLLPLAFSSKIPREHWARAICGTGCGGGSTGIDIAITHQAHSHGGRFRGFAAQSCTHVTCNDVLSVLSSSCARLWHIKRLKTRRRTIRRFAWHPGFPRSDSTNDCFPRSSAVGLAAPKVCFPVVSGSSAQNWPFYERGPTDRGRYQCRLSFSADHFCL